MSEIAERTWTNEDMLDFAQHIKDNRGLSNHINPNRLDEYFHFFGLAAIERRLNKVRECIGHPVLVMSGEGYYGDFMATLLDVGPEKASVIPLNPNIPDYGKTIQVLWRQIYTPVKK